MSSHMGKVINEALELCLSLSTTDFGAPDLEGRLPNYFARFANRHISEYKVRPKTAVNAEIAFGKFFTDKSPKMMAFKFIQSSINDAQRYDLLYDIFEDDFSRATLDWFIKIRVAFLLFGSNATQIFPPPINEYECNSCKHIAFPYPIQQSPGLEFGQYVVPNICEIEPGDVIIDAGGYDGNTTYMFRSMVKDTGHVYVFEPLKQHIDLINKLRLDNNWENVDVIGYGLWDKKELLPLWEDGSGSTFVLPNDSHKTMMIPTTDLDSFVEESPILNLDLLKMDIEGAEQKALLGGAKTIKRFAPKLAISAYHLSDDVIKIPEIISSLGSYRYYLRHHSQYITETVLYALPS